LTFQVTQRVDENGVVLVTFTGTWDSNEWARQIEDIWRELPADFDPEGRPILSDLTNCRFPETGWVEHFRFVARKLANRRKAPFRRAILISGRDHGENDIAVRLLDATQRAWHNPNIETRGFTDRDEAYAWVTVTWLARAADEAK